MREARFPCLPSCPYEIFKLIEKQIGAELVRIFGVEIREVRMEVVAQRSLAGLHAF